MSSDRLAEQEVFDIANTTVRINLASVQGAQTPWPYGGKARQIMVDLDPDRLYAWNISPSQVVTAITSQNLILPAGTAKFGNNEMPILLNASPTVVDELNNLPIKTVNGTPSLHQGRGPRSRRISGSAEHRASGRQARRADGGLEGERGVHA